MFMSSSRILVVDDEVAMGDVIVSMCVSAGYTCTGVASGEEALATLNSGQEYELMLSDVLMPQMNGIELLKSTKETFPDMTVVMVTAVQDVSVALDAVRNDAYDYVTKPFEREQLLNTVQRALEYRNLTLENRAYQLNLESLVAARTEQLHQAMANLERSYDVTLEALGDALDLKDAETEGHSKRVTAYTITLAQAMGLAVGQIRVIARGAFLHDIGKMAIPDAILRKAGPLNKEEMLLVREHCNHGYQMLRKIPFLLDAAEIVYAHQERYDGTGYPRGLNGEEIPLGARIFAIADALDAITSDRPYRAAQSIQAARGEINRWSGRQFDPKIVSVFLSLPDSVWEDLRQQVNSQYTAAYFKTDGTNADAETPEYVRHAMTAEPPRATALEAQDSRGGLEPWSDAQQPGSHPTEAVIAPPSPTHESSAVVPGITARTCQSVADVSPRRKTRGALPLLNTPKKTSVGASLGIGILLLVMGAGYSVSHRSVTPVHRIAMPTPPVTAPPTVSQPPVHAYGAELPSRIAPSSSTRAATGTLRIEVAHHFTKATLSVWIDGRLAYSHSLQGEAKKHLIVFRSLAGFESGAVRLAPGKHQIDVRVKSSAKAYDQSKTVAGEFVGGQESVLQINFSKHGEMYVALI
jgi:putative nucleotidyltransferase with HDIG domain